MFSIGAVYTERMARQWLSVSDASHGTRHATEHVQ